jgi:hypothetical protein
MMETITRSSGARNMNRMESESSISPEILAELKIAIENAMKGVRDPEQMRAAAERLKQGREELQKKFGVMNVAVDLIREGRDEE